ncbi:LysR family transcriptional regulator [Anaerosalibacter massiliensis]|uniref:LysR family transcriptional regulator n=1 Tax=Anaerosalibacter massiliensis TaxID=1347392 RepID=A0A9X2MGD3_9FIRM|nr:LysR family transcriptional regulator [Anaerosalibacter massiliensis]MCR2044557.1 LysR family transcriptional regulator [Anaerosalibacter massiliensis]
MLDPKLKTLLMVAKTFNFTHAAEQLALTQPAVSHHINKLEEELGVKIFNRNKGKLKLTSDGEIVVMYAKRMKSLYNKLQQNLIDEKRHITSLTVGITHTAESNFVAEVLAKCCNLNKGLSIKIITESINNLYNMLINYEIDLAIVEGKINDTDINSLLLDTDYLVLVVANNNPLSKKNMVTINDIKKEKMILRLPNSGTRNLFIAHLESLNISIKEFNVILEVDNIATIKDLVRQGFGISILARSVCLDELKNGEITVLPIENLSMVRETSILYHKDFNNKEILQAITKIYNETAKVYK